MASYVQLGQSGKVYGKGKPPRKKKHKNVGRIIATVLLVAVLVAGIGIMAGTIVWMSSSSDDTGNATTTTKIDVRPSSTKPTAPTPTVPTKTTQTTAPSFTTAAPTVNYVSGTSGSFVGNEGYKVKLIVEYGVVKDANGKDALSLRVFLQSFSLTLGKRNGKITVNGQEIAFRSEMIELEENVRAKTLLTEQMIPLDGTKEFAIDVQWHMGITYSQVDVEDLAVSGVITLP
jgi:hypothetical protein